jgi:hypothetical protein
MEEKCAPLLQPAYRQGYSLMYGPPIMYVQVKMIATIYERLLKAKSLIRDEAIAQF